MSPEEDNDCGIHRLVPTLTIKPVGIRAEPRLRSFEFRRARRQEGKMACTLGDSVLGWLRERQPNGLDVVECNTVASKF
jgi:hypothetical protein